MAKIKNETIRVNSDGHLTYMKTDGKFYKRVEVPFEIPMRADPIQATLDFKYKNYGYVEYFFSTKEQKNGFSSWVSDEWGIYCSNCEETIESIEKVTPYCPYCGKPMKNYNEIKYPYEQKEEWDEVF